MLKVVQVILTQLKGIMTTFTYGVTNVGFLVFDKLKFDVPRLL